jgi:DNA helicase-2/ATP-dependent DNA helicase PcrA
MTTKLNSKQYEAVQHKDGPCLVIACPGSGKTLLLTERVAELIEKGVDPSNIFCITFTNKAASEMRERIARRLGVDKPGGFIGTFHGLCVMILRQFAKHVGYKSNFTIIDQKEQKDFISKVARQMGYDFKSNDTDNVTYIINTWRENLETSEELNDRCYKDMYEKVARQYLDKIKSNNIIDFSGILYECAKLLDHEEVLLRLQNKCQYIQVDEFQDSNYIQIYIKG